MAGFPPSLQEIILKILEYAVTVVNCIPEQELLSLCCLLQQPITPDLKHTILSFFVKLLSFDQQYKKVLREVGVLEVLLEDLKQHKFLCGSEQHADDPNHFERKSNSSSSSFKKHLDIYMYLQPVDKQSLLDSGILCCLIHILNSLVGLDEGYLRQKVSNDEELLLTEENQDNRNRAAGFRGQIFSSMQVEGSVVHIMKALAAHPSAAQSLIEDNSLMLLFQMVANGSLVAFSQYKEGLVPLHTIQLHRHAMQILGLLLGNDNGSTAKYIRKHHLIKVLLLAVKDFNPDCGDSAYTMSMIDLLLECVELSYRPEAGGIRLREDIHNAHGYQFLVQFALVLAKGQDGQNSHFKILPDQGVTSDYPHLANHVASKASHVKPSGHGRSRTPSSDRIVDDVWDKDNDKVKDLEAVQMLQDIFLKADSRTLQGEVLNKMFKIFSSHLDNYKLCQQLRTVPLLILNMAGFPPSLQEIILKILEYAVTVVNCIPEQELLSLCCLLQQPITPDLKHTILSFFVKLLSFDQQYKKVLREVGVLEVLLEDLKQHKFLCGSEQHADDPNHFERKSNSSSSSFKTT
ncbi:hypothetical protein K7X08_011149 [Anisodus acutangulus]|uniref:Uncharacterized protein n=1 Tax=Anisodus acutangulus TaxID=402998 RepID=A0A9Q1R8G2_9SOLA|nr:hypothetical protein K7X08_011149 [Anisodus acutangulus]